MLNKKFSLLMVMVAMLGLGLFLTSCESDSVAPNDETPQLSTDEKAGQAGAMASAAAQILPQIVTFNPAGNKTEYSYDFDDETMITGMVYFDFRLGGADGTSAAYDDADWGRMFTTTDEPIVFNLGEMGGSIHLDFDIMASIVNETDTATIQEGSTGTFTAGAYTATFSFANVEVIGGNSYPQSGTMTFVADGDILVVTYDGDDMVTVSMDGVALWNLDLNNGSVTPISA